MIQRLSSTISTSLPHLTSRLSHLNNKLNVLTGYSSIQSLKAIVSAAESTYISSKNTLSRAKQEYETSIVTQVGYQREINSLLQRKHAWNPVDVSHFTELYTQEHALENALHAQKLALSQAEEAVEEAHAAMMKAIRDRYQEEQAWSDYVRSLSTYGTVGIMFLNVALFVFGYLVIEPRRRETMRRDFVGSVDNVLRQVVAEKELRDQALRDQDVAAPVLVEASAPVLTPDQLDEKLRLLRADLFQQLEILQSKVIDVTRELPVVETKPEPPVTETQAQLKMDESGEILRVLNEFQKLPTLKQGALVGMAGAVTGGILTALIS